MKKKTLKFLYPIFFLLSLLLFSSLGLSSDSDYIRCEQIRPFVNAPESARDRGVTGVKGVNCSDISISFEATAPNTLTPNSYSSDDESLWTIVAPETGGDGAYHSYVGPSSRFKAVATQNLAVYNGWQISNPNCHSYVPPTPESKLHSCYNELPRNFEINLTPPEYFEIRDQRPQTRCVHYFEWNTVTWYSSDDVTITNKKMKFNQDPYSYNLWVPLYDCPFIIALTPIDTDLDGVSDFQEVEIGTSIHNMDTDGDNHSDFSDAFPLDENEHIDTDSDGIGNHADTDDDNDGIPDETEIENGTDPLNADTDNDGVNDNLDVFPNNSEEISDADADGIGNNADTDDDNDGVSDQDEVTNGTNPFDADTDKDGFNDSLDEFPLDSTENIDSDGDGVGNNSDVDDDNDGVLDEDEIVNGTDPLVADSDGDGNSDDAIQATDPRLIFDSLDPYYGNFSLYEGTNSGEYLNSDSYFSLSFLGNNRTDQREYEDTIWVATCGNFGPLFFDYDYALLFDQIWLANDGDDDIRIETWGSDTTALVSGGYGDDLIFSKNSEIDVVSHGGFGTDIIYIETNSQSRSQDRIMSLNEILEIEFLFSDHDPCSYLYVYKLTLADRTVYLVGTEFVVLQDDSSLEQSGIADVIIRQYDGGSQSLLEGGYIWDLYSLFLLDADGDGTPDFRDNDDDNDGVDDYSDAFPKDPSETTDSDDDGVGDNSDAFPTDPSETLDSDGDGVGNNFDAFPFDPFEYLDSDLDFIGNNADTDDDNDSVLDVDDAFPLDASESVDTDSDGIGNNADTDDDNDSVLDVDDAFPLDASESVDNDSDGIGNNADTDDDNDFMPDETDAFPLDPSEAIDTDGDGIGNNADTDDDNDAVLDADDAFPLNANESSDTDGDGVGDNADAFPNDASETLDSDSDGIGDNADAFPNNTLYKADSDLDGMPDAWETRYGLDPNDASDATSDQDNDGVTALDEFLAGTIPSGSLDIDGNEDYDALTDGLLLLRGMFGLDGSALVTGTIASDAAYTESVDIESRIATLGELADIDGNGDIDALTDGLLTLRYLFGLQGDTLINGVVAGDATRTTSEEIEAHLETLMPAL